MKIKYYAQISDWTGCTEEEFAVLKEDVREIPVRNILCGLADRHGEKFKEKIYDPVSDTMQEDVFLLLNGRHLARLMGLDTIASEKDTLAVIPVTEAG